MIRRLRFAAPLIAAASLAGCVVGPRYHTPAPPSGAQAPFVTTSAALSPSDPLPPYWWRLYNDPVLDGLVQQALTDNADLKVAAANLAYAQALTQEAIAGRFPSTSLSASGTYQKVRPTLPGEPTIPPFFEYGAGFNASYEVDLFGRVRRTIEAARANAQAVAAAEDQTRVTVAGGVASAYANLCGLGEQLNVARRSLAIVQQAYNLTLIQRNAGALSDFDLDRERVLLAQTQATLSPLEGQRRAQLFILAALVGRTPHELPTQAEACVTPPTLTRPLPVGDGVQLIRRRPDLREAERNLAAAVARVGVATAELYPTVTIPGSISNAATQLAGLGSYHTLIYNVGPLITWAFPNLLGARARVRESSAQASGALASFDAAVLNALRDVEQALSAYAAELDHNAALKTAATSADAALKLANIQYTSGAASFLDILTTQQTDVEAAQALAASDQALAGDQVAVFQALGGGWEGAPPIVAPRIN